MYTDKCEIQSVVFDTQFGGETKGIPFESICRLEINDVDRNQGTGTRVNFKRLYIVPPGTDVKKGYNIKTISQRGATITDEYVQVDEVFPIGAFSPHHMEVYIY